MLAALDILINSEILLSWEARQNNGARNASVRSRTELRLTMRYPDDLVDMLPDYCYCCIQHMLA